MDNMRGMMRQTAGRQMAPAGIWYHISPWIQRDKSKYFTFTCCRKYQDFTFIYCLCVQFSP